MKKFVIFAFRGDPMCFIHVMLNALDMKSKGYNIKIVLEGEAVKLVKELTESNNPVFKKTDRKKRDLIKMINLPDIDSQVR